MGWERKRGKLVEFNAFIRGSADRRVRDHGRRPAVAARRALRHHARRRHRAAAIGGGGADRNDRPSAQPRRVRSRARSRRARLRHSAAARERVARERERVADSPPSTPDIPASIRTRPPSRTCIRICSAKGRSRERASTTSTCFVAPRTAAFPTTRLLSHDLLEGTFARAGLVTDVEVFDDYPTRYLTSTRRMHRWIRGDWQLLRWLTSRVPGRAGSNRDPLSSLSRWKIADNMRRSATPVAQLVLARRRIDGSSRIVARVGRRRARGVRARRGSSRSFSPPLVHRASRRGVRTTRRSRTTRSRALQQIGSGGRSASGSGAARRGRDRAHDRPRARHATPDARVADGVAHGADDGEQQTRPCGAACGRRCCWARRFLSFVAWRGALDPVHEARSGGRSPARGRRWRSPGCSRRRWRSRSARPLTRRDLVLDADERAAALRYAARHWRYFDRFVTADTHWLVARQLPGNSGAGRRVAHVADEHRPATARDGVGVRSGISHARRDDRPAGARVRFDRPMPRVHGHFFNWYDLENLRVLDPPYVSTVDSGNLAGHLVALAAGMHRASPTRRWTTDAFGRRSKRKGSQAPA